MKKLFRKQEINLLKDSSVINDYPELADLVAQHPEYTDKDLPSLPDSLQNLLLFEYGRIIHTAAGEWSAVFSDDYPPITAGESHEHARCELCGNSQCYDLYPITNLDATKILYVGSSCITRFNINGKQSIEKINAERISLRKYSKLNSVFPGIVQRFFTTNLSAVDTAELLIPNPLYSETISSFKRIRSLSDSYLNTESEYNAKSIEAEVRQELSIYDQKCMQIDIFVQQNSQNWLVPNRRMVSYMKGHGMGNKLTQIRNSNSTFNDKTLCYAQEPDFVKEHLLPIVQHITEGQPIQITGISTLSAKTSYEAIITGYPSHQIGDRLRPHLTLPHEEFAKAFGSSFFSKRRVPSQKILLSLCKITDDTPYTSLIKNAKKRLQFYNIRPFAINDNSNELYLQSGRSIFCFSLIQTVANDIAFFISPNDYEPIKLREVIKKSEYTITFREWRDIAISRATRDSLYYLDKEPHHHSVD